jgi:ribosomal-protein-serine acetyltransferase
MFVMKLINIGFLEYGLNRVEIACETGNLRRRAIPESLGFKYEGIQCGCENLYGKYVDHGI